MKTNLPGVNVKNHFALIIYANIRIVGMEYLPFLDRTQIFASLDTKNDSR